jgi:uncharacterized iron-regulated membrane protein
MQRVIRKIHIYLGLLNFCALTVFGIAGLTATFEPRPDARHPDTTTESRPFAAPPNASDKQVADLVFQQLHFPMSQPIPAWALHRDAQNHLQLDFWTFNVIHKVTVLEQEHRLQIENVNRNVWVFLNDIHTLTLNGHPPYLPIRLWQYYNEFAIWSLILMAVSGIYLWLASRPGFRWAQLSFAGGSGAFLILYFLTR